jgi:serine/threonine protein kinase
MRLRNFAEKNGIDCATMARTKQTKRTTDGANKVRRVFAHPFQRNVDIGTRTLEGIKILKKIARGAFGRVYQGRREDGMICAVKFVDLRDEETDASFMLESSMSELMAEEGVGPKVIKQWRMPKHDLAVIATELWSCTLEDYLQDHGLKKPGKRIMSKLHNCVEKMHETGHVHLDLHGGNVLLKSNGQGKVVDVALTDFGKSSHIQGIAKEQINSAVDYYQLKRTDDPTKVDWQMVNKIKKGTL